MKPNANSNRLLAAGLLAVTFTAIASAQSFTHVSLMSSVFSDANGWNQPQYGTTIMFADINGDGRADVCGRGTAGVICQYSMGASYGPAFLAQSDFSDANFWNQSAAYYGSLRFADVNGDNKPDLCGRGFAGIYCALNAGNGTFLSVTLWSAFLQDDSDGDEPHYGSTIVFADINGDGKADVCGRGHQGVYCALSTGSSFGAQYLAVAEFADAGNWFQLSNAQSIRFADVNSDGRPDLCARSSNGIACALNIGNGKFAPVLLWEASFGDGPGGWGHIRYGTTIMFADLNGDKRADVCGRGPDGVRCAVSSGSSFVNQTLVQPQFSDANGWNQAAYYGSLRLADVNGDNKPDLCGRGAAGILCALNVTQ